MAWTDQFDAPAPWWAFFGTPLSVVLGLLVVAVLWWATSWRSDPDLPLPQWRMALDVGVLALAALVMALPTLVHPATDDILRQQLVSHYGTDASHSGEEWRIGTQNCTVARDGDTIQVSCPGDPRHP